MSNQDVLVIGGGAIGSSIAWRLAGAGVSVTLVDDGNESAASGAAAGMLAPVTEIHYGEEALLRLNLASARAYPGFVEELEATSGVGVGYLRCGTMLVARDHDEDRALGELFEFQKKLGLGVERLGAEECRSAEPYLARRVRGGILVEGDHQVDNRALLVALRIACERAGVSRRAGRAERIEIAGGRATGVTLAGGESIHCGTIVLAAGCWSGEIEGIPPDAVPAVRPVKGQLLHLRGNPNLPLTGRTIRGADVYVVARRDGRVVVGATVEERGFEAAPRAEGVYLLLRDAYELLPGILELELVEVAVGLRPGSPDNAPLLGRSALDGLILATGHYRNGILLTPLTASTITSLVTTGVTPGDIEAFSPRRSGIAWGPG